MQLSLLSQVGARVRSLDSGAGVTQVLKLGLWFWRVSWWCVRKQSVFENASLISCVTWPLDVLVDPTALREDVFHLLASKRLVGWWRTSFSTYGEALNAWLAPLAIQRENLPGVYTGGSGMPFVARFLECLRMDVDDGACNLVISMASRDFW